MDRETFWSRITGHIEERYGYSDYTVQTDITFYLLGETTVYVYQHQACLAFEDEFVLVYYPEPDGSGVILGVKFSLKDLDLMHFGS